jgi:rod shape determining protein RodA
MLFSRQDPAMRGRVDWMLVGAAIGLVALGTMGILSAASPLPNYGPIVQKHFAAVGLGILLFLFGLGFNYQIYQDQAKTLYVFTIAMMLGVLLFGSLQRGQRAWIRFPFFNFQPSELARIITVLVLANFLDRRAKMSQDVTTVLGAFAIVAPVMILVLKEPDFSSTLSFFPMLIVMLFCAGANLAQLAAMAFYGALTLGLPLAWTMFAMNPGWAESLPAAYFVRLAEFHWPLFAAVGGIFVAGYAAWRVFLMARIQIPGIVFSVAALIAAGGLFSAVLVNNQLKGYQRNRVVAFLTPEADPRGASYNVQQAQIALGSGGLWGKGVFSGTQSQLGFLPERHTDFIFAVIGEEMGFIGAMAVLALYLMLIWRLVNAARMARDRYGYLVCCGLAALYGFSLLVNVGMCLGMVPVVGIPLPLVSYGGSNLTMTLLAVGIAENIFARRYALL